MKFILDPVHIQNGSDTSASYITSFRLNLVQIFSNESTLNEALISSALVIICNGMQDLLNAELEIRVEFLRLLIFIVKMGPPYADLILSDELIVSILTQYGNTSILNWNSMTAIDLSCVLIYELASTASMLNLVRYSSIFN